MKRSHACNPFPYDRDYGFDSDHIPTLPPEEAPVDASQPDIKTKEPVSGDAGQETDTYE